MKAYGVRQPPAGEAIRSLLLDPTVGSATAAERFLDDILEAHRRHLPRFWAD